MATAAVLTPHDVPTFLNYYAADPSSDETPYNFVHEPPAGKPRSNVGIDKHDVVVRDARGKQEEYGLSLDTSGFQYVSHVSEEKEFNDEERIKNVYYKEVEELLKKEAGAKRVFIFDHTIRLKPDDAKSADERVQFRGPVERVHIDQTFDASVARVHHHLGEEAERLLKGRVRIINVWRPIHHPVAHKPLAVSDWRHLDTEHDLVSVRHIYPDRVGATFSVKYNPDHKWYYLSNQTPDEVTLIKCYDSKVDRARLTPHSAFPDAVWSTEKDPQRESIEVRALVFSDSE